MVSQEVTDQPIYDPESGYWSGQLVFGNMPPQSKPGGNLDRSLWLLEQMPRLSGAAFKIAYLYHLHSDATGTAWPGVSRLAELSGLSRATIFRALAELRAAGIMALVDSGKPRWTSSTYQLNPESQNETVLSQNCDTEPVSSSTYPVNPYSPFGSNK